MREAGKFYIDGKWVTPRSTETGPVINPNTEEQSGSIYLANDEDVDLAVQAAHRAFPSYSATSVKDRLEILGNLAAIYERRLKEVAELIHLEMGAPMSLSLSAQAPIGLLHIATGIEVLKEYRFEEKDEGFTIYREPIGVCGFITPWNWPANQVLCKVVPALAVGCTMVLKPSELSPYSAELIAEILDEAGVPAGVFNLIQGNGPGAGAALSKHPLIDMVSFTGSTRAGIAIATAAAPTVKRVSQELGGKSPNIILPDANFEVAVTRGVDSVMRNSGQTCAAPTRMLVPHERMDEACNIAAKAADKIAAGEGMEIGPVVSAAQWEKIQGLIQAGIDEGAELVAGGPGRPAGINRGYHVRPTVFGRVTNDMKIAQEEIFGPVLSILGYEDEDDAIRIANDTPYGLAGYVESENLDHARQVGLKIRAGQIRINDGVMHPRAPFGGYKMSGNGREWGEHAFHEFVEIKSMM